MQLIWQLFDGNRDDFPLDALTDIEKVWYFLKMNLTRGMLLSEFLNYVTCYNLVFNPLASVLFCEHHDER